MIGSFLNIVLCLFVISGAIGTGHFIYAGFGLAGTRLLDNSLMCLGLGLGVISLAVACLGFLNLLEPRTVWIMSVIIFAIGFWGCIRGYVEYRRGIINHKAFQKGDTSAGALQIALWAFLAILFLTNMVPPMEGDTLHSYLDVPSQYMRVGGILNLPFELHSNVPMNIHMLSVLALGLKGDELAQMLTNGGMVVAVALVIFAMGREFLSKQVGLLAALLFVSMPAVMGLIPSAKVNLGAAFFDLLAVYCVALWILREEMNDRWLLLAGVFSGLALGSIYYAGFTMVVVAAIICWGSRRDVLGVLCVRMMKYGLPAVLLASPWYIKNYLYTGNPVFPAANALFGLPSLQMNVHSRSLIGLVTILWDMSIDKIAHFGKPVGPMLILILPALAHVRPLPRPIKVSLVFSSALFLLWYVGVQRPRNFLPGLGVVSLASAYAYIELSKRSRLLKYGLSLLLAEYFLFNLAEYGHQYFMTRQYQRYIFGLEARQAFVHRLLDMHPAYPSGAMTEYINANLPKDAIILSLGIGNGYYIQRRFIDSRMVDRDFSRDAYTGLDQMAALWRQVGITHVWERPDFEGALPGEAPEAKAFRDAQFRSKQLQEMFQDKGQRLYRLSAPGLER